MNNPRGLIGVAVASLLAELGLVSIQILSDLAEQPILNLLGLSPLVGSFGRVIPYLTFAIFGLTVSIGLFAWFAEKRSDLPPNRLSQGRRGRGGAPQA